ncbi:MAG: elongation factor G [Candidatus Omnitrophica bacterium]|nr:elongation factor G [Candidatus Omnitrophota bacterium]
MAEFKTANIRNTIFLGHSHSGKTMLSEMLLHVGGAIANPGSVQGKNTVSDYNEDEKERQASINSSVMHVVHKDTKINIIDTPGFSDFLGQIQGGIRAVDSCILVVNASAGVQVGTESMIKLIHKEGLPCMVFINRMDKEDADFNKSVESIKAKIREGVAVAGYPVGKASSLSGVVNLLTKEGMDKLSGDDKSAASKMSDDLIETIAESDDALLEKYLDKGELSKDEALNAFRKGIASGKIVPLFSGSATKNIGIKEFLDAMVSFLPSPADKGATEAINVSNGEPIKVEPKEAGPLVAQVFKTISDPYVGQINVVRVFRGALKSNATVYNVTKQAKEKLSPLGTLQGREQKPQDIAYAGDIISVVKLKDTETNDTLGDEKTPIKLDDINFSDPAISFSIKPKSRSDEDKIMTALHKITAEDKTFKCIRDAQTKELIASGMGEFHINVMLKRMQHRYGVSVDMGTPKVAYKETISGKGDAHYRHKKQSGGAGQFAEVWLRIEPLPRGTGFEFVDDVVGGAIPTQFVASCEKGIRVEMEYGVLAGFTMVDIRAIVYDGKTHPVDSKDIAFQIASRHGFKDAVLKAKPVILEPIMHVDISIPDEYMGDITGSLNSRRGRVLGMEPGEGVQTIKAQIPLEEMYKYVNELKSLTAGRGTYTMQFSHDEIVPSNISQIIIDKAKKAKEEAAK